MSPVTITLFAFPFNHHLLFSYLPDTMLYLLSCLKRERERSAAFQAIGLLAVSVQQDIAPHLPRLMEVIRASLPSRELPTKKQKNFAVDPTVFTCISMLAKAVGPAIARDVRDLLEPMLAVGLSPALTAALRDLATQIPPLKKDIQDGLLKMLSMVLMGRPLRHPGAPRSAQAALTPSASSSNLQVSASCRS